MGQGQSGDSKRNDDIEDDEPRRRRRRTDDDDDDDDVERGQKHKEKEAKESKEEKKSEKPSQYELKEVPPEVVISNENRDPNNPITTDLMGDKDDDDVPPGLMDQMQRLQAERRKKEAEKDKQVNKEKEYPMIYGGPCTGANEFNVMVFTAIKLGLYALVLALTVMTMTGSYTMKVCNLQDGQCLFKNASHSCFTTATTDCLDACIIYLDGDLSRLSSSGCYKLQTPSIYQCITDFSSKCLVTDTCPESHPSTMKTALQYTAIAMGIAMFADVIYLLCMLMFKGLHVNDFGRLSGLQRVLTLYVKFWGPFTQGLWVAGVITGVIIIVTVGSEGSACSGALTPTGDKYELFDDSWLVAIVCFIVHAVVIVVGTYFRARVPLRGHLYRPSTDSEIQVPFGIDCKECRDKPRPRWASGVFKPHLQKENVVGCVCNCLSFCLDTACFFSFQVMGWALERFYKHRHFIGP